MKKTFVLCLVAAAASWTTSASAVGQLADINIVDRSNGVVLPVYSARGEYWVAGVPGAKYAINIRNASGQRVLAVTSVDGINVVSGETASTAQTGYVFSGRQQYDINGWRKSNESIAAFEFTASPNSYAERTGRPLDVGVIGVALFRERIVAPVLPVEPTHSPYHAPYSNPYQSRYKNAEGSASAGTAEMGSSSANTGSSSAASAATDAAKAPAPAAAPALPEARGDMSHEKRAAPTALAAPKLGTGHGERENSYVRHTAFERDSNTPNEVIRIRYDSRENLIAMGILPPDRPSYHRHPNAFPQSNRGFVPDPHF